jgi:hypothetical protein
MRLSQVESMGKGGDGDGSRARSGWHGGGGGGVSEGENGTRVFLPACWGRDGRMGLKRK